MMRGGAALPELVANQRGLIKSKEWTPALKFASFKKLKGADTGLVPIGAWKGQRHGICRER